MSEMLGNHYFQVRKYLLAEQVYEKLPLKELSKTIILKKLIICYTQTNKLQKALKLFLQLIENDLGVFGAELNADDCPCNELIFSIESGKTKYLNDFQRYTSLGILWMFCNYKTSSNYFKMAMDESPGNEIVKKILQLFKNYSNQNNFNLN